MKTNRFIIGILLCGIFHFSVPAQARVAVIRGPYLQLPTPTSMTVRWRTDIAEGSRVRYGRSPSQLDKTASGAGLLSEHIVTLDNLEPATEYFFQVGNGIDDPPDPTGSDATPGSGINQFRTPPAGGSNSSLRIWVLGDVGKKNETQRNVRDSYLRATGSARTDFVLLLGDNAYLQATDTDYQRAVFDVYDSTFRNTPVWSVFGNHDAYSATSTTQSGVYYDVFTFPTLGQCGGVPSGTEAYYSFDWGNTHFVCLDSQGTDRSADGAMVTWLKADLAANQRQWIIAAFHHPPYSKGTHDSDDEKDSGGRMRDMRETVLPVLEAGGVDVVLTGHSHVYERTYLLDGHYGKSRTFDPAVHIKQPGNGRPDGGGVYRKPSGNPAHRGEPVVVMGCSGKAGTDGKSPSLDHPAMVMGVVEPGSGVLEINGNELKFTFLRDTGVQRDGFTIVKN